MKGDDPRHGTNAGYMAHKNSDTPICTDCAAGRARYERWRKYDMQLGRARIVPSIGSQRRVRSLQRLGWSLRMIALESGWNQAEDLQWVMRNETCNRRTAQRIAETYERLSMTIPPYCSATVRARKRGVRLGFPPPLAWDDIDNPHERPKGGKDHPNYRAHELVDEWHHLRASGESIHQAARQLGVTVEAIEKAGERVAQREAS